MLEDFCERFAFAYDNYLDQGNKVKDKKDLALDFLYALEGTHYGTFVAEVLNHISKGAIMQPESLHKVFLMVNTRVVVTKSGHNNNATFVTIEETAQNNQKSNNRDRMKKKPTTKKA